MSAADKLAQVLVGHNDYMTRISDVVCDCGETVWWIGKAVTMIPGATVAESAHAAHVAAVVLAHLTAEGWAQGREEWGIQVHIASVAGRGTRVEPMDTEERARDPYRHVFVAHGETVERKVPVRRRVTDWEPVETGDQE